MATSGNVLRPVGMLEKLYTARQVLGIYNSIILTATYVIRPSLGASSLYSIFCAAIPGLLRRHPSLCCYVEGQNTAQPRFRRLNSIRLPDVLQILALENGASLAEKLQELHDQEWPMGQKPLWRLVLMRESPTGHARSINWKIHVAFIYHHAIGDGMSGSAFHESLFLELENIEQTSQNILLMAPTTIDVPSSTTMIEPVERLTLLPLSWFFLIRQVAKEYGPRWLVDTLSPIWAGLPVQTLANCPYRSRVRFISIPVNEVATLLAESRKHSVTLTSLLTAVITATLAKALSEASCFLGVTLYSLRHLTGTSVDDMAVQISGFETLYPADLLDRIRKASETSEHVSALWGTASYLHTQMQDELATCPRDNLIGLLPYISDYFTFYKKKFDKPREASFELSNLGMFRKPPGPAKERWLLEGMTFTQGAAPAGPAFAVNAVSVQDGPLTLAITWQDTVVSDEVVDALANAFADLRHILHEEASK